MIFNYRIFILFIALFCPTVLLPGDLVSAQELKNQELSPRQNCREERHAIARMNCFADLADRENDVAICDSASPEALKFRCYAVYAQRKSSLEVCRMIASGEVKDGCLSNIAGQAGDPQICAEIRISRYKDSCYLEVVKKTGQVELCGEIGDRMQQMICSGNFGQ